MMSDDAAGNDATAKTGRGRGNANFKIDEDLKLTSAYISVTTNAAVGTDQDGGAFWEKIRESFVKRGGSSSRSLLSLKNRFNKVLQAEVNKYIGILHTVLREFHSGWVMIDYVTKAKDVFQLKTGKFFKHDMVYDLLKRALPKYELSLSTIDARVVRALFLMDCDNEYGRQEKGGNEDPTATTSNESGSIDLPSAESVGAEKAGEGGSNSADDATSSIIGFSSLVTPRPTIGKKKAKQLAQANSRMHINANANKKLKLELKEKELKQRESRNESLRFLAEAAKDKMKLAQEQLKLQIYMANPNSAASRSYFARMTSKFCAEDADQSIVADDTFDEEEVDDDDEDNIEVTEVRLPRLPDTERLAASLVNTAAAAQRSNGSDSNEEEYDDEEDSIDYVAGDLRNFMRGHQRTMPVINFDLIKGSDLDEDKSPQRELPPPPEDSQLTTG